MHATDAVKATIGKTLIKSIASAPDDLGAFLPLSALMSGQDSTGMMQGGAPSDASNVFVMSLFALGTQVCTASIDHT